MKRYNLCVVLVSLEPPSPAVLLADLHWTSFDEHTCFLHGDDITVIAMLGVLEGPAPPVLKPAIGIVEHNILLRI